jgi:hypothetical protein
MDTTKYSPNIGEHFISYILADLIERGHFFVEGNFSKKFPDTKRKKFKF